MNIPLTSEGLNKKMQGVVDDIDAMKSLNITDGFVHANNELFRTFRKMRHALVHQAERNGMTIDEIAEGMKIPNDEVIDLLSQSYNPPVDVGMVVRSKHPQSNPLRSGAECYPGAIVISMHPFVMASFEADMRWGTWKPDDVEVVEPAKPHMLKVAMTRLKN